MQGLMLKIILFQSTPFFIGRANVTTFAQDAIPQVSIHALLYWKGEPPAILILWILKLSLFLREPVIFGQSALATKFS